jgi:glycosyltransferase involved in cell wall biosynthesis
VSVVTPTKDRLSLLRHTVASVMGQTYPAVEHIVMDGDSTDGTQAWLATVAADHPVRWVSEPDEGMYAAINKGLEMATGDFVAYLNSDDLYFPWTLETVVQAFERHPQADFVYGDALSIDDVTARQVPYWVLPPNPDYLRRIGFLAQPAVFWRRSAYELLGPFDESLRFVADCDYWMRAIGTRRFVKVDEFLAIERDHRATLRDTQSERVWEELDGVRSRYVASDGPHHARMLRRHRLWGGLWKRWYTLRLVGLASLPAEWRRGPGARLLASGNSRVLRVRMILRSIPRLGPKLVRDVMEPGRSWLEPPWP